VSVNHERTKENKNVMISQRKRRKRKRKKLREGNSILRDRPFNLHGFLFCSEIFFRTIRELEYLFFSEFNIFSLGRSWLTDTRPPALVCSSLKLYSQNLYGSLPGSGNFVDGF
jgi:hypothetical protein